MIPVFPNINIYTNTNMNPCLHSSAVGILFFACDKRSRRFSVSFLVIQSVVHLCFVYFSHASAHLLRRPQAMSVLSLRLPIIPNRIPYERCHPSLPSVCSSHADRDVCEWTPLTWDCVRQRRCARGCMGLWSGPLPGTRNSAVSSQEKGRWMDML